MRFVALVILTLASVAFADLNNWNDAVGDVPQCIKTCYNDFYNTSGLKAKCGSADKATVKCLCSVQDSVADINSSASDLSSCIQDGCSTEDLADAVTQLQDFQTRFEGLMDQCSAKSTFLPRIFQVQSSNCSNI
jgi:hypothetical protein